MDCKETRKAIPLFFADELEGKQLRAFVSHVEQCPECMEELTIQYLATEGVVRLEEGTTFNLDKELQDKIRVAVHREVVRKRFRYLLLGMEIVSVLIIGFVFLYVFIW